MNHRIIQADVMKGLASLPDESVQCVVTSPPYWGLRDYGVEGQIGLEATPEEYVEKMVAVFREVKRVLRQDGTIWLNMGDCYAAAPVGNFTGSALWYEGRDCSGHITSGQIDKVRASGLKPKDLLGMPWRLAFALQADGWWLRSDIVWSKPNPMPESVTDRPTKSHEYLFLLAKSSSYFYDADAIREKQDEETRYCETFRHGKYTQNCAFEGKIKPDNYPTTTKEVPGHCGRNRRTVWEIPTQPFPEAHIATFPEALVEPCIKAGTSERGACPRCGSPWERVVERAQLPRDKKDPEQSNRDGGLTIEQSWERSGLSHNEIAQWYGNNPPTTTGWSQSCTCGGEPVPCVVLDPFAGSGTVAKVARDLGRSSIGIELNPAYVEMQKKRLRVGEQISEVIRYEVTVL